MKPEVVTRRIEAFHQRFGEAHLDFAYHAAFPLALTPDLLYRLWANFQRDIHGEALKIPWLAVADLLLSSLCDEVGYELYEMETEVRNALLRELKVNPRFGEKRIHELSNFLLVYVKQQLESHDPDMRDFAQVQTWTALAYTKPGEAAREIASVLAKLKLEEKAEWVRMASIVETFAEPLAGFQPLLIYSREMANFVRGKKESATAQITSLIGDQEPQLQIAGINLQTPEQIATSIEEVSPITQFSTNQSPSEAENVGDVLKEENQEASKIQIKRLLIATANPKGTARLRLDEEVREIKIALKQTKHKYIQFDIDQLWATRVKDFKETLFDFKPDFIHFSGNGWEEGLGFENSEGKTEIVSADALAALFKLFAGKVECVVLNADYSEITAEAISKYVDYAIGISQPISDRVCIEFATGFYDAIGAGNSPEKAYEMGCAAIQLSGSPGYTIPVLKKRIQ